MISQVISAFYKAFGQTFIKVGDPANHRQLLIKANHTQLEHSSLLFSLLINFSLFITLPLTNPSSSFIMNICFGLPSFSRSQHRCQHLHDAKENPVCDLPVVFRNCQQLQKVTLRNFNELSQDGSGRNFKNILRASIFNKGLSLSAKSFSLEQSFGSRFTDSRSRYGSRLFDDQKLQNFTIDFFHQIMKYSTFFIRPLWRAKLSLQPHPPSKKHLATKWNISTFGSHFCLLDPGPDPDSHTGSVSVSTDPTEYGPGSRSKTLANALNSTFNSLSLHISPFYCIA